QLRLRRLFRLPAHWNLEGNCLTNSCCMRDLLDVTSDDLLLRIVLKRLVLPQEITAHHWHLNLALCPAVNQGKKILCVGGGGNPDVLLGLRPCRFVHLTEHHSPLLSGLL